MERARLRDIWTHRQLLWEITRRNIRRRYRGTALGPAWPFLHPLALLATYTVVFHFLLADAGATDANWVGPGGWLGTARYAAIIFTGMVAFQVVLEAATAAPRMIAAEASFVKHTVFPLHLFGVALVASLVPEMLVGLGLVVVAQIALFGGLTFWVVTLPLALVPLLLIALTLSWGLAALGTYAPDLSDLTQITMRVLFFLTPILYPLTALPGALAGILKWNPMAFVIEAIRAPVLWGDHVAIGSWVLVTVAAALAAWWAFRLFERLRPGFADVL